MGHDESCNLYVIKFRKERRERNREEAIVYNLKKCIIPQDQKAIGKKNGMSIFTFER